MALNAGSLLQTMLGAAATAAGNDWAKVQDVATHELQIFAMRLVEIERALMSGQIKRPVAVQLVAMARNHMIATVALLSTMLIMAAQHALDAAVAAVVNTVNTSVGFQLVA